MIIWIYCTLFFLRSGFVLMGFTDKVFNEAFIVIQKNIVFFFLH